MLKQQNFLKIILLVLVIASTGQFATDIYLPSLPSITRDFATSASIVQYTITAYLIGYGISNIFYGPLCDRFGRKNILIFGLIVGLLGSILCSFAASINHLIIGRFIQGFGLSACIVTSRAIMRDSFHGTALAKANSYLATLISWVLGAAPIIGGYLQQYFNWRASFLFLLIYTISILVIVLYRLPETNPYHQLESRQQYSSIFSMLTQNYLVLLSNRTFLGYALISSCTYSGIIAYATLSPYLYQTTLGLSPTQNGWVALFNTLAFSTGALINSRLVSIFGADRMIEIGISLKLLSGILLLFFMTLSTLHIYSIIIPMALFCMGAGSLFSNASSSALNPFAKMAGTAGALLNFLQIIVASLVSALIAQSHQISLLPISIAVLVLGFSSLFALKCLAQYEKRFETKIVVD